MRLSDENIKGLNAHHLMNKDAVSAVAVTIEELNELSQVLAKFIRYRDDYQGMTTDCPWRKSLVVEISDVIVMLQYVTTHFGVTDEEINQRIAQVIERYRIQGGDKFGQRAID